MSAGEVVVPLSLDLNGNAITVSNAVWEAMGAHVARDDATETGRCTPSAPMR